MAIKVGIWGLYNNGNFGDDLMALMIRSYLQSQGYIPSVFNASAGLKRELGCAVYSDIEDFVKENDVIVVGGGGMLVNNSLAKFLLKKNEFFFEISFLRLLNALKKYGRPLIPISIGGGNASRLNNPFKNILFSREITLGGTVRLPSDLSVVDPGVFDYKPDIVLSTRRFFPAAPQSARGRVILNLKKKSAAPLIAELERKGIPDSFDVVTFESHSAEKSRIGSYEYILDKKSLRFDTISEGVHHITSGDLVVSSKLHVGVTAMSYGIPFLSFRGPAKAREFLKDCGKTEWIIDDPALAAERIRKALTAHTRQKADETRLESSFGHFNALQTLLKQA